VFALVPGLRRDLLANARHLLPDATPPRRERQARAVIAHFAQFIGELLSTQRIDDAPLLASMRGREHIERSIALGRGVIAISLHIGNYELAARLLAYRIQPLLLLYERDPAGLFELLRSQRRDASGVRALAVDAAPWFAVEALAVLRQGGAVLLAGDLGHAEMRGLSHPFLQGCADFAAWPLRLAVAAAAPIVPCCLAREHGRYRLTLWPAIVPQPHESPSAVLARLMPAFAAMVQRYPEQWLIVHRYWQSER
jgi:KDO2-lipid IV(A) lauroyltransferase